MASPFPCASTELDYPLYALDFDPEDSNRLVVAGGGGATRSGVGNKITVLETASENEIRVAGEIDLSRDEDSVMSLAVGPHKGKLTYIYAGINSSPESIAKGKNEPLRAMAIEASKARSSVGTKTPEAKISELSRTSLFANPDADTYQRLLRLSGSMGAAATAMGKEPQLAVFEAAGANPNVKGVMELPREAEDLDILQTGPNQYQVAFTYKYQLHVVNVGENSDDPHLVFEMPDDHGERPVFRSIRYLSPDFILAATNLPKRSGVVLYGLRLPEPGSGDMARLAVTARIPRKISATAMAVANLSPPASPGAPLGETQFVVAVAGHDSSVSLYTLKHVPATKINLLAELYPLTTLKDVHGSANITGLAFSTFIPPKTHIRPQHLKLASISLQKTVAVHSIPLKKHVDKTRTNKKGPPRPVRYVVAMEARSPSARPLVIALTIMVLIMAVVGQSIMEMYGQGPTVLGVHRFLPSWHGTLRDFDHPPAALLEDDFIKKLAGAKQPEVGETLVMWEADHPATAVGEGDAESAKKINVDVHDEKVHGPGKTWEELGEEQKEAWKQRLQDVGAWTQGMGESVFKGILFGELAGAIGHAVGG
ncbi:hypothetical protein B0I35DRAFT_345443 [Stachybotrys elegans]|uniref:Guanine nucleotide-exchange factor SEC12 n=1 Tax=Stachybotrys elegans TaxID=80388 RepID=A0A8K0T2R5_9HYPO|nr:hypothetical protein B0I35DRAFT_345443 [Stachybotrys elegans]